MVYQSVTGLGLDWVERFVTVLGAAVGAMSTISSVLAAFNRATKLICMFVVSPAFVCLFKCPASSAACLFASNASRLSDNSVSFRNFNA